MRSIRQLAVFAVWGSALACSTEGAGVGELKPASGVTEPRVSPVRFTWESDGPSSTRGRMSATVPGLGVFQGKYMQITSQTDLIDTSPYFGSYWYPGWGVWDGWGWGGYSTDQFITNYSGKVIAVLRSDQGQSMRCRFRLARPSAGPEDGGVGECELSTGDQVNNVVLEGH